jgi:multidrug efflux system membrane fusion protein
MNASRKRFAIAVVTAAVIASFGGFAAFRASAGAHDAEHAAPPAASVEVATVISRDIIDWQSYSGRLEAVDRVEIRPLVSGTLTEVHFTDGSLVKKGDVLFTIDPRPYAAEVARARAQLAAAEARVAYTGSELARSERLLADNATAKRDHEEKQNAAREASANLLATRAALDAAQLDLEHTRIVAPVSGRVSRAEVTTGNVVSAGAASQALTTLVSVSKMYASFEVDEQAFLKYINAQRLAKGSNVPVFMGLMNESNFPHEGVVASVDNRVDVSSGTIRVRALFDNADGALVPGLYARIRLGGGAPRAAVLVDEKAIGTDQDKRFVLVVGPDNKANYREVRIGSGRDGLRIVESGLAPGERIVVNGLQRTRPGDPVQPKEVPMSTADGGPGVSVIGGTRPQGRTVKG